MSQILIQQAPQPRVPDCYVNIGNGEGAGACEVHDPAYDFNAAALPLRASFFARPVETRLAKWAG